MQNAADMGTSEDCEPEEHTHSDSEPAKFGQAQAEDTGSTVYISVFDPIGELAFKPSKTKPLPKWTQLLPNNFKREREHQNRGATFEVRIPSQELVTPTEITTSDSSDDLESLEKDTQTYPSDASTPKKKKTFENVDTEISTIIEDLRVSNQYTWLHLSPHPSRDDAILSATTPSRTESWRNFITFCQ